MSKHARFSNQDVIMEDKPTVAGPGHSLQRRVSQSLLTNASRPSSRNVAPKSSYPRSASTIQGRQTARMSVLMIGDDNAATINKDLSRTRGSVVGKGAYAKRQSFKPKHLLDIENGTAILVTQEEFLDPTRFQELDEDGALVVAAKSTAPIARKDENFFDERKDTLQDRIKAGDIRDFATSRETFGLGRVWRNMLRRALLLTLDDVNALRFSRQLQLSLPFLSASETYLVSQVIEALDAPIVKADVKFILRVAFKNRNVSRIMVQTLFPRWDFLWHLNDQVYANRRYDGFGQLPFIGFTSFTATENFPATRQHVINASLRVLLGESLWLTRVLTQNRQGLATDHPDKTIAQNLAAESNGFETANRNQFGNYFGRQRTNAFRLENRLPTDESILRTFVASPMATMINNGVVHTLRQIANHWNQILNRNGPNGNFGHQRMELLDPFETMRFHMPVVCVVLSSLRGRVRWDSEVLAPFMKRCQDLKPAYDASECRRLILSMKHEIVLNLCAGVSAVIDPMHRWLDLMLAACDEIQEESKLVFEKISVVELGLRVGHDLVTQTSWKVPSDKVLKDAILRHIREEAPTGQVSARNIRNAMSHTTPRDKRTLIELVNKGHLSTKPAQLLLGRVKSLLQREIKRDALDCGIRELSVGDEVASLAKGEWYWVDDGERRAVYSYVAKVTGKSQHRFIHVDSGNERLISWPDENVTFMSYVPVAEAITRAQKCFMQIELDHSNKFKYNAFMEFKFLRVALRRLAVISQVFCDELDNARLNVMKEIQRGNEQTQVAISDMEIGSTYYVYDGKLKTYNPFTCEKKYTASDPEWETLAISKILKAPPQSMLVVGGGPTGLITTVHCTESVLVSGGVMKLYEARDAFNTGASTFERAQIVRLDSRWIAMLRYHLGTGFENVFIPTTGETDPQLGNTLPDQGFVEITIKDLENMLHVEVSKLWSKGLIECYTDSRAQYDLESNSLTKQGQHLKAKDQVLRRVDPQGRLSSKPFSWKVADFTYASPLSLVELIVGREYGLFNPTRNKILPFTLAALDSKTGTYTFKSQDPTVAVLKVNAENLPDIFEKGVERDGEITSMILESVQKSSLGGYTREELPMREIKKERFTLDVGHTHVVECIGKPHGSSVHFDTATSEPYGVCCIQGLKISMGMHNFGEKRWGSGLQDDFRSTNDQNTRIIGDFTKVVNQLRVAEYMVTLMDGYDWSEHFRKIVADSKFPSINDFDPVVPKMQAAVRVHAKNAPKFNRPNLQTRFFETGDNYYLGMEFTREYEVWKKQTIEDVVLFAKNKTLDAAAQKDLGRFKGLLGRTIDRLWYEACLEIIRKGDVYNPGARGRIPKLYTINSYTRQPLKKLPVGDGFRIADSPRELYCVVVKKGSKIIVRNVEGYISEMSGTLQVLREGDLTRKPDGNRESAVSLATFPVSHYVNHRTLRLNNESLGYIFAFVGDEQATPHFMRYSGLTGACINAMALNNFIKEAINGVPMKERFIEYADVTDWSNSEVVIRGFGSSFGRDGFLRPGFEYRAGIDFLHAKVIEHMEKQMPHDNILTTDWKIKFAAALVPRGMEMNVGFKRVLLEKTRSVIVDKFLDEIKKDKTLANRETLYETLSAVRETMEKKDEHADSDTYWNHYIIETRFKDPLSLTRVKDYHAVVVKGVEHAVDQVVEFATNAYLYNRRITSEMFQEPKPVDSIVDDFAVEAQNFANSLAQSVAFGAGALALSLVQTETMMGDTMMGESASRASNIAGALLAFWNISVSFTTMTNVSRYKIRNEESRILFYEEKYPRVMKGIFALLPRGIQDSMPEDQNPFLNTLAKKVETFRYNVGYYGATDTESSGFEEKYYMLQQNSNEPAAIRAFQKFLAEELISDIYHRNSYLQENLVDIFKVCDDVVNLLASEDVVPEILSSDTKHLFDRLKKFEPRLDDSLQRGHIYWGFLKHRKFAHWDIMVVIRYFYSWLFCASAKGNSFLAPVETETLGILKETKGLSNFLEKEKLRKEIRDLSYLYWSTRESEVASMVFVSSFLVHIVSWVFTISRLITWVGGGDRVTNVAAWATLATMFGAIVGSFHFLRQLLLIVKLYWVLSRKVKKALTTEAKAAIKVLRHATFWTLILTMLRLIGTTGAAISFPWSLAASEFMEQVEIDQAIPLYVGAGSTLAALLATVIFFCVEYKVRYELSPRLGEVVGEAFRREIEKMYRRMARGINDIDPKQEQEREIWEDVAREFLHKYRFDTVLAADRFGAILQYIQAGMERRGNEGKGDFTFVGTDKSADKSQSMGFEEKQKEETVNYEQRFASKLDSRMMSV